MADESSKIVEQVHSRVMIEAWGIVCAMPYKQGANAARRTVACGVAVRHIGAALTSSIMSKMESDLL